MRAPSVSGYKSFPSARLLGGSAVAGRLGQACGRGGGSGPGGEVDEAQAGPVAIERRPDRFCRPVGTGLGGVWWRWPGLRRTAPPWRRPRVGVRARREAPRTERPRRTPGGRSRRPWPPGGRGARCPGRAPKGGRHVEDQPIGHPARPAPPARRRSSHAQSPIESGSTTGGGGAPSRWADATRGVLRSGVAGGRTPKRTGRRRGRRTRSSAIRKPGPPGRHAAPSGSRRAAYTSTVTETSAWARGAERRGGARTPSPRCRQLPGGHRQCGAPAGAHRRRIPPVGSRRVRSPERARDRFADGGGGRRRCLADADGPRGLAVADGGVLGLAGLADAGVAAAAALPRRLPDGAGLGES